MPSPERHHRFVSGFLLFVGQDAEGLAFSSPRIKQAPARWWLALTIPASRPSRQSLLRRISTAEEIFYACRSSGWVAAVARPFEMLQCFSPFCLSIADAADSDYARGGRGNFRPAQHPAIPSRVREVERKRVTGWGEDEARSKKGSEA